MNKIACLALLLSASCATFAVGSLRETFRSPQGAARENTGPLFWMHGTETPERLREYVGRVDESGQGVLTIESRPHVDWMRDGWWRDVDIVLDACTKRGMKMMVFDDYWWPSQGMGGKYPIPEKFQCRDVKGSVYPIQEVPAKAENEIARVRVREVGTNVFELAANGDRMIVYAWFTSNGNYRFPTVNGLDEEAVDWFIANYYQPYYDRYKEAFADGTIPGFFFDEPQFRSWWGPALAQELKARGEDAGELLTALKFRLADPEAQARALYRYHDARAETWGRTMYGRQSDWCRKHGVYSSGHFLEHANDHYSPVLAGGNVMQQMKYVEVPGVDLVCRQYYPNQRESEKHQVFFGQMPKYASSTAHVYNRHGGLNWCEIFGAYGQDITYPQMKWLCDWHQYQGCYYLIPHSFNPKAPDDRDCPPYFYNGGFEARYPLFRVWADYNNRCALLLSQGEHVCHIAQCVPGVSFHVGKTIRPEMFAFAIQDAQLDSDWMGYDAVETARIEKNLRTGRPALRTENGTEHYDILSLPAAEYVPFAVLEKALAFAKAGGVVVGYGIKPCNTPTRGKTADDVKRMVDAIFAQPTALFLEGEPDGAALRAALVKNYPGTDQPLAVRDFDFPGLSAEDGRMLAVNHYVKDGAETLFIANQDFARRRDLAVRATWPVEKAELWDPMQGTVEKPVVEGGLVRLALEPSQAVFLVWPCGGRGAPALPGDGRARAPRAPQPRVDRPAGEEVAVSVKETVTRMVAGGTNEPVAVSLDYAKWIWHPVNPKAKGKVTFRAKIDAAAEQKATITFSCDNAAVVRVNGKQVAEQKAGEAPGYSGWRSPTTATFALKAGANDIEVLAENAIPGLAGFVASVKWPSGLLLTDGQAWNVSRKGETPVKPLEICRYGQGAWKRLGPAGRVTRSPFEESVATACAFTLPPLKPGARVFFVCDGTEGESSAAVTVNGAYAGGFIGAPYRLDVTRAVKEGANTLETKPFRLKNPRIVIVSAVPTVLHVDAERGDDAGDGSAARPFKTPAKAKETVRSLKNAGAPGGVVVEMEGVFSGLKGPVVDLGKDDGGASPSAPVVWRAGKRGALLTGACRLTAADFTPVSGAARERLKPEVRGKVYACDLTKFGVGELKPLPAKFGTWSEMELISSGRAMTIARYPDTGWLEISNVVDRGVAPKDLKKGEWEFGVRGGTFEYSGDAPSRWDVSKGVFVFGFWCYDWASDTLRLAKIDTQKRTFTTEGVHTYGIGKPGKWAKAKPRYFVYNLLEELDAPGEWYVDRETRTLYFYPTADGFKDVALSLAKDPLVRVRNAANVVLEGLEFKYSTGPAVNVSGANDVTLDGLKASWLSRAGIGVWGGSNVTVRNCRLWQIGSTGLDVLGGDRKSLTKCGHRVYGNDIGYCGRLSRISGPCLRFGGCGVTVEHNYFHDTPYIAVSYGGNEHLVQYNEIECAMLEAGDGAGMYTGRDWGSRGNVVRWNYLHHFGKDGVALREAQGRPSGCEALKKDVMVEGIYLDDCDSGETIYGNLFYKAGRALFTGGGRDNKWTHNLVLDCTSAVHFDTRGLQRARPGSGIKDGWDLLARIEACAYTNEPWASRYPELIGIMEKEPLLPIGTEYVSNVAVNCGYFFNSWGHATKFLQERAPNRANVSVNARDVARELREYPQTNAALRAKLEIRRDDALAAAVESADPRKVQDLPQFRAAFPSFPRIPVEKIGPELDFISH